MASGSIHFALFEQNITCEGRHFLPFIIIQLLPLEFFTGPLFFFFNFFVLASRAFISFPDLYIIPTEDSFIPRDTPLMFMVAFLDLNIPKNMPLSIPHCHVMTFVRLVFYAPSTAVYDKIHTQPWMARWQCSVFVSFPCFEFLRLPLTTLSALGFTLSVGSG